MDYISKMVYTLVNSLKGGGVFFHGRSDKFQNLLFFWIFMSGHRRHTMPICVFEVTYQ